MISLKLADRTITTEEMAFVMGIVNTTPDSFWKGSRGGVEQALRLIDEGAAIIDLGAESTRPGSDFVEAKEEIKRLVPVLKEIRRRSDIPVSIDTRKAEVFKACLEEGADILNDVTALEDDEKMASLCAEAKVPVILMHWDRNNRTALSSKSQSQAAANFGNTGADLSGSEVFEQVNNYLKSRVEYALKQGISSDKIILDPGIGFNKKMAGNLELIRRCGELLDGKYPVLMALSRKTVIGEITGKPVDERLAGTLAADMISVMNGAFMVRVHDVKEAVDSLKVLKALR